VNRVVLRRCADGAVEATECADGGAPGDVRRLPAAELPGFVLERERAPVRWVWDDTTRWYPPLLDAKVRVARCADLRLGHAILRRSPFADRSLLGSDDAEAGPRWRRSRRASPPCSPSTTRPTGWIPEPSTDASSGCWPRPPPGVGWGC
jgi:DNA polymerase-1